ncbi:hypothetical protein Tco_1412168 [Tanacetum coccineum]
MLNKDNYVPWSSRLLRYAKSKGNGKLLVNSIKNGPYVRRMIHEPDDPNNITLVAESTHEQTDDEIIKKEAKQMETDDQAIQTILMGLLEDIYVVVDSCKIAQEIWLCVEHMMKGELNELYYHRFSKLMNDFSINKHFPKKIDSNMKFLNNLQLKWKQYVTTVHQTKDLYVVNYIQLYDFLKFNQAKVVEIRAKRLATTHDPLALMENYQNPYNYSVFHPNQPSLLTYIQQLQLNNNYILQHSFNTNYLQQLMPNPEDISVPKTTMNMALVLITKEFKLNYSTPTNYNQRISSNTHNRQITQSGMNMG